ncbi:MAG: hypothetical protein QM715_18840 [Nibricoccus sp.]
MKYIICVLLAFTIGLQAKDVSSEKPKFKISFPDEAGWTAPVLHEGNPAVRIWSAENQSVALVYIFTVIDAPMPEAKPTFRENAEEWARGLSENFTQKISFQIKKLADHDAAELVTSLKSENGELFYSNWMIQIEQITYGITIIAKEKSKLTGSESATFLKSLKLE